MTLHYKQHSFEEAREIGAPLQSWHHDRDEYDYRWGIWLYSDDIPLRLIGHDGGEPEDQTLYRDWAWVVDALNEALQKRWSPRLHRCARCRGNESGFVEPPTNNQES